MFCTECGNELTEEEKFCPKCGQTNNNYNDDNKNENNIVTTETKENKSSNEVNKKTIVKTKKKIKKYFFIILTVLILVGIGVFVYFKFIKRDDTKPSIIVDYIKWDKNSDISLDEVSPANLNIAVKIIPSEHEEDIKYVTNCGKIRGAGKSVVWDLTKASGKCTIIAIYRAEIITKQMIVYKLEKPELGFEYEVDLDSDEDLDLDGLTNKEEKEYGTNPENADSDLDGLSDYEELKVYNTNPNKKDTDGDELNDFDEIELELDPNKASSKDDGVKDGDRLLSYEFENDKVKISIKGKGNIASSIAYVNSNTKISGKNGLIDNLYSFYTDGKLDEAIVTIKYTDEEINTYGLNEDNLSIYYYNDETGIYEKIDSVVDKENKTITAKLSHFSLYVVGDSRLVVEKTNNQVIFVIDNSWSMYSNEQYKQYTGEKWTSYSKLDANDIDNVRFDLTKNLAKRLSNKNYTIGLSEFKNGSKVIIKLGDDISNIDKSIDEIIGHSTVEDEGTNSSKALYEAINQFDDYADNKVIVILTDGEDNSTSYSNSKIISLANEKNVKICAIGFGAGKNNTRLQEISYKTGCKFYTSESAEGLNELFDNLGTELDDGLVDIDNDGIADGVLIADSGFRVNVNGFSFNNYQSKKSVGGHCFGMATFAELYYINALPLESDSKMVGLENVDGYNLDGTFFANSSNNLFDYKLQTKDLKYEFSFDYFGLELLKNTHYIKDKKLLINDDIKEDMNKIGFYQFEFVEASNSELEQLEKYGQTYTKYENYYLDEDKMKGKINSTDEQLFNAINLMQKRQKIGESISSGTNSVLKGRNFFGTEHTWLVAENSFIDILESRLKMKDPSAMYSIYDNGLHAVNAIDLYQDIDNPNKYYIGIYDNNHANEKRYVTVVCGYRSCVTEANQYYSNSNQLLRISKSVADDLKFFY